MDDTSGRPHSSPLAASRTRKRRGRLIPVAATVAAAGLLLTVSACGNDSTNNGLSPSAGDVGVGASAAPPGGVRELADGANSFAVPSVRGGTMPGAVTHDAITSVDLGDLGRSQIKTAQIGLRSKTVADVVTGVVGVANAQGGYVASENTATDTHGVATSSAITIRVPVDTFDAATAAVSKLGQLTDRRVSTQDVTGRVADVSSRVTSAKAAISQLQVLFSHATKLSDIITLESQLQERQSDLESLLAQQRALTSETSLSTISVQVSRPPVARVTTVVHHEDDTSGFLGGLRQGWDALASTFVTVSHGLGAALPLGVTLLVLAGLVWAVVRRLPRRRVGTTE